MGAKSKRKTKLKHQDFQKAKLKVGKKLPKAQNETRTNFKSRAIVIREQLRMPTTGPPGVDDEKPAKKESKCKYSVKVSLQPLILCDILITFAVSDGKLQ